LKPFHAFLPDPIIDLAVLMLYGLFLDPKNCFPWCFVQQVLQHDGNTHSPPLQSLRLRWELDVYTCLVPFNQSSEGVVFVVANYELDCYEAVVFSDNSPVFLEGL